MNAVQSAMRALAAAAFLMLLGAPQGHADLAVTKHNLSASGPGTRRATSETETCIFCHGTHNTDTRGQLWNRRLPSTAYTPYASSTIKSQPGQPNGASLLCLSCHDGTIALGEVKSRGRPIPMTGGALSGGAVVGTNLSAEHPVSFVYDGGLRAARGELAEPSALRRPAKVRLDAADRLQCTSCHDPHDDTNGKFLVVPNTASALCVTCHQKRNWATSAHRNSTKTWRGGAANPWPPTKGASVFDNGCENCHRPHAAGGARGLLNYAAEEANCYSCHSGTVASKDIRAEFAKPSSHDVGARTGTHEAGETDPVTNTHVECADCHDPHSSNDAAASPPGGSGTPTLPGALAGARGVGIGGAGQKATTEFEICLRCHSGPVTNRAQSATRRQIQQKDKRLEFQLGNPSFHPVAAAGRSSTVPSLLPPWTTSSRMRCTDCHNNNAGPYSSGNGTVRSGNNPNGPHGSIYPGLLERQYQTADRTSESPAAYALCYKCHNRDSILADQEGSFKLHRKHVVDERTPCNACHDPHGISAAQGASSRNARLMNFDTSIVAPSGGRLYWERVGVNGGRCYLTCHGRSHDGSAAFSY